MFEFLKLSFCLVVDREARDGGQHGGYAAPVSGAGGYAAPSSGYGASTGGGYAAPSGGYGAPSGGYGAPCDSYGNRMPRAYAI